MENSMDVLVHKNASPFTESEQALGHYHKGEALLICNYALFCFCLLHAVNTLILLLLDNA